MLAIGSPRLGWAAFSNLKAIVSDQSDCYACRDGRS